MIDIRGLARGLIVGTQSPEFPEDLRGRLTEIGRQFGISAEEVWETVVTTAGLRRQQFFRHRESAEARAARRAEYGGSRDTESTESQYQRIRFPRGTLPQQGLFHQER